MTFDQTGRFLKIEGPFDTGTVALRRLSVEEHISALFRIDLDVNTEEDDYLESAKLLGEPVTVSVAAESSEVRRYFHGIISRIGRDPSAHRGFGSYHMEVVPSLWLLTRNSNCRIFQDTKVTDILSAVLDEYDFSYRLNTISFDPVLEYCVQYRESDFAFISRLAAKYGIYYYFEHSQSAHEVIFSADQRGFADCDEKEAIYSPKRPDGPIVRSWSSDYNLRTGTWVQRDFNFETPGETLETSTPTKLAPSVFGDQEFYDYPGGYQTMSDGRSLTDSRMEEEETGYLSYAGAGQCASFSAGHVFKFEDDPFGKSTEYVLTRVQHGASDETHLSGTSERPHYANNFGCMPKDTYRPKRRAPRPTVYGPHTAIVDAAENQVECDKYGRVKVMFHWDRDSSSSCWIRVAQDWAGKKFGSFFWPRGGMEVVVDFLEGDMDRPLITGCVYNKDYMPPYALPGNKTRSGIKTRSSPGTSEGNYNEVRFEDKSGSEEIFVHAQKDMNREVENDDSLEVKNAQKIEITANRDLTVKQGNQTTKISSGKSTTEAAQSIELKVGGNSIKIDQSGITIKGIKVEINGSAKTDVKGGLTTVQASGILTVQGALVKIN